MYQYFEDKKELFMYCIKKAFELSSKYYDYTEYNLEEMSIFDYIYLGYKKAWPMMKEDKELFIFFQEVASGNNYSIKDEALEFILKASRDYMYKVIKKTRKKDFYAQIYLLRLLCCIYKECLQNSKKKCY